MSTTQRTVYLINLEESFPAEKISSNTWSQIDTIFHILFPQLRWKSFHGDPSSIIGNSNYTAKFSSAVLHVYLMKL